MAIITRLKAALEFTRFADPNIREALVDAINELAADMDEVEFEEAVPTRAAFSRLGAAITEYENKEPIKQVNTELDEDIDGTPDSVETVVDEEDIERTPPKIVSDGDEDDIEL